MAKKKKKRKIPFLTQLRRLEKKADKALSEYVREMTRRMYGKCPLCTDGIVRPVEACFHFVRRKRKILRWSIKNLVGSCHRCNYLEYRNPDPSRAWYIRKHGLEQYLWIVDESAKPFVPTLEYLQGIVDEYTAALKTLTGGSTNVESDLSKIESDQKDKPQ